MSGTRTISPRLPREFLQGQVHLFEQLARGADPDEVLHRLLVLTERIMQDDLFGSVMRYHPDTDTLTVVAAPHLSTQFRDAIDGLTVGPDTPTCARTVWSGEDVITENIAEDDRWGEYQMLARAHDLQACWSLPIKDPDRRVLGTFTFFRSEAGEPSKKEYALLEESSHLASLVLERTRRREVLQDTRKRHVSFLEEVPVGVYRTAPDGHLLYANPALIEMLGANSFEELQELNVQNWYVEEGERAAFRSEMADRGTIEQREARLRRLDGETIDIMESARSVCNDADEVQYYEGIIQDVTERKEAQRALRDSERKLRSIVENVQPIFFMIDQEGTFLLSEGNDLELLDLTPDEVVGASLYDLFGEYPVFVEKIEHALDGKMVNFTSEIKGRTFDTWCTPYYGEDGDVTACIGMSSDITERREAQSELRQTKNFYEQLIDQLPMELAVFDTEARFIYVNSEGVSNEETREWLMGRTNEEYCRHHDLDIELGKERDQAIRQVAETGEPVRVQESIETSDGARHYIRIHVPVTDLEGRVTNVVGCSLDITERVRSEYALREAKEEAEEAAKLKSAMLANMSHEIRTPLTSITGFAKVLEEEGAEANVERLASLIVKSGNRLLNTLDSVLQLSSLEAGSRVLNQKKVDLTEEAHTVITEQRARSEADGIDVRAETPDEPVYGYCDPTAVQRILSNLVSNGIKFTDVGGEVVLRVASDGDRVSIKVEDTGIGMSDSFQEEMFEAFKQESSGLSREYEGSGLGLSLVKELVDSHGGSLEVESSIDEGTTIAVKLPRYND